MAPHQRACEGVLALTLLAGLPQFLDVWERMATRISPGSTHRRCATYECLLQVVPGMSVCARTRLGWHLTLITAPKHVHDIVSEKTYSTHHISPPLCARKMSKATLPHRLNMITSVWSPSVRGRTEGWGGRAPGEFASVVVCDLKWFHQFAVVVGPVQPQLVLAVGSASRLAAHLPPTAAPPRPKSPWSSVSQPAPTPCGLPPSLCTNRKVFARLLCTAERFSKVTTPGLQLTVI